ncbi:hypothetical protein MMC26_001279 [Xylographa opegraphella]|nr:hypothetical protein [Xylographa opegraphella]
MADPPKPTPMKRPLFNQPAWSKPRTMQDSTDFFDRSSQVLARVSINDEQKRKKKAARQHQEQTQTKHKEEQDGKRRRLSNAEEKKKVVYSSNQVSSHQTNTVLKEQQTSARTRPNAHSGESLRPITDLQLPNSLAKSYKETIAVATGIKTRSAPTNIIDLEGSEGSVQAGESESDDDQEITLITKTKPVVYDDFPTSDEEFPELARKAREKARRKRLEADSADTVAPDPPLSAGNSEPQSFAVQASQRVPTPPPPDPVVSLLITSRIPNTKPLIVNRRLSQRLKDVRIAWCQRQQFTTEATQNVILTWRGKRLFDVSSCKSIGIGVDSEGNIVMKGEKDIFGEADRQIHLEAMTEETLRVLKKAKEHAEAEGIMEDAIDEIEEPAPNQPNQEQQIRIILKAKELKDFKLIVKPTTLLSRMINAFRIEYNIDPGKEVYLVFDGDRLDPPIAVGDTELSDMDSIEVFIR